VWIASAIVGFGVVAVGTEHLKSRRVTPLLEGSEEKLAATIEFAFLCAVVVDVIQLEVLETIFFAASTDASVSGNSQVSGAGTSFFAPSQLLGQLACQFFSSPDLAFVETVAAHLSSRIWSASAAIAQVLGSAFGVLLLLVSNLLFVSVGHNG
jgi:hypothetical protein